MLLTSIPQAQSPTQGGPGPSECQLTLRLIQASGLPSLLCLGSLHKGFGFLGSLPEAMASLPVPSSAMSVLHGHDSSERWPLTKEPPGQGLEEREVVCQGEEG